jgi:hypothetical protein
MPILGEIVTREEIRMAADRWCRDYSNPGQFEESGQQEAFFAGADAALELFFEYLTEYRKAYDESIFPPQDMNEFCPECRAATGGFMGRFVLDNCLGHVRQAMKQ